MNSFLLAASKQFRKNIQNYNNALSFTSLGKTIDYDVAGQGGVYSFRISGGLSHRIGGLLPTEGLPSAYSQIYVYGGNAEEQVNLRVLQSRANLDPVILRRFQDWMYENNPYAQVFQSASATIEAEQPQTLRLRTITGPEAGDHRRYNAPTVDEVAMIVDGDGEVGATGRDLILRQIGGPLQHISELHTAYFALRYPLLFLWGSRQWHEHYRNPTNRRMCCLSPLIFFQNHSSLIHTSFSHFVQYSGPEGKVTNLEWFAYLLFT